MVATDRFALRSAAPEGPAEVAFAISPHATDELAEVTRAIYVGTGGDLALIDSAGNAVTFRAVPAGSVLPVRARAVRITGTTAADLVGLV